MFHKNANNEKDKIIFPETKKLFNLRVKIYKKLLFERINLRPEKTMAERVKLKKQRAEEEKGIDNTRDENNFIDYKKLARLINFKSRGIKN